MPTCIICHTGIETGDKIRECPNNHPVHEECLIEWLVHAQTCPLCQDPYSSELMKSVKYHLDAKAKQKEDALQEELLKETQEKIEKIAEKIVFMKSMETIEGLIEKQEFDASIDRLDAIDDDDQLLDYKSQKITFLRGKINYLRGRFDLAINLLFKLVKVKFDYPEAFLYLGKSYEQLGLKDKAQWAFDRAK